MTETDEQFAVEFRQEPPEVRRAVALDLIEHADSRFDITGFWTLRVYECEACGHETLTVGHALPERTRCYNFVRDPSHPRRRMVCGGKLDVRWAEE